MTRNDLAMWKETLQGASDLEDLCAMLQQMDEDFATHKEETGEDLTTEDVGFDLTHLPVFGGSEPEDTAGVWSWDETRLLIGETTPFEIVNREDA